MSNKFHIDYLVTPEASHRLGGLLSSSPLYVGQLVSILGNTYTVKRSTQLEARFFIQTGTIKLDDLQGTTLQGSRLERTWKECGINSRIDFVRAFFNICEIDNLIAKRTLHIAEFTDISLLHGK